MKKGWKKLPDKDGYWWVKGLYPQPILLRVHVNAGGILRPRCDKPIRWFINAEYYVDCDTCQLAERKVVEDIKIREWSKNGLMFKFACPLFPEI